VLLIDVPRKLFPTHALGRLTNVSIIDIGAAAGSSFVHAKLLVAETDDADHVLYGSANCTSAALTLRSRTVEGVYQEIWGALIAYNLIRREIASAAWEAKLAPTDISFVRALHTIQHEMMWAALTPCERRSGSAFKWRRTLSILD
jgi:hypothetical protein